MRKIIALAIVLISISVAYLYAQRTSSYGIVNTSLSTSGTGAVTGTPFALPVENANMITWQVVANGSALSVNLEGSLDNSTYTTVDSQTVATGGIRNFGFTGIKFVRCSQVSRTGGTTTTCTFSVTRGYTTSSSANLATIAPNAITFASNGTSSAPNITWTTDNTTGIFKNAAAGFFQFVHAGSIKYLFGNSVFRLGSGQNIGWSSNADPTVAVDDTIFTRNAAGIIQISGASSANGGIFITATVFASLGTPSNGTLRFCSDCTIANPCASGGTGALAKRLNGVWVCN